MINRIDNPSFIQWWHNKIQTAIVGCIFSEAQKFLILNIFANKATPHEQSLFPAEYNYWIQVASFNLINENQYIIRKTDFSDSDESNNRNYYFWAKVAIVAIIALPILLKLSYAFNMFGSSQENFETAIPCKTIVNASTYETTGNCTIEEKRKAMDDHINLWKIEHEGVRKEKEEQIEKEISKQIEVAKAAADYAKATNKVVNHERVTLTEPLKKTTPSSPEKRIEPKNIPCEITVSAVDFKTTGNCTIEELIQAQKEHNKLRKEEREKEKKIEEERYAYIKKEIERQAEEERTRETEGIIDRERTQLTTWLRETVTPALENNQKQNTIPCKITASAFDFDTTGTCTIDDIIKAKNEHLRLWKEANEEQEKRIEEQENPVLQKLFKEKAALDERIRRRENPTLEEQEENSMKVDELVDKTFSWLPGYTPNLYAPKPVRPECPTNIAKIDNPQKYLQLSPIEFVELASRSEISPFCKQHAKIILGVSSEADQSDIEKKFRQLSKLYHSDKNPSEKSLKAFHLISIARETLTSS